MHNNNVSKQFDIMKGVGRSDEPTENHSYLLIFIAIFSSLYSCLAAISVPGEKTKNKAKRVTSRSQDSEHMYI